MAAAGFYFIGSKSNPDLVRCFLCFKELDGWEEEDDPWLDFLVQSAACINFGRMTMKERGEEVPLLPLGAAEQVEGPRQVLL
ncbi:hypothetical protein O3P69_007716 [Scylla paramamosain]